MFELNVFRITEINVHTLMQQKELFFGKLGYVRYDMTFPRSLSRLILNGLERAENEKGSRQVECQHQVGWVVLNNQAFMMRPTLES